MNEPAGLPRASGGGTSASRRAGGNAILVVRALMLAVGAQAVVAGSGGAQEGCFFGDEGNDVYVSETLPGVGRVNYITRPHLVCDGGVQIWADSAVSYADRGVSYLIGSVRYEESSRVLRAREAQYFSNEGRLQAQGDVVVVDEARSSTIRGGDLVYLLDTDFRDESEMTVTIGPDGKRPRAVLTPPESRSARDSLLADSARAPPTDTARVDRPVIDPADTARAGDRPRQPYTVVGDRIFLRGSGYFTSTGDVEIVRDSLFAFADSAEYTGDGGLLTLVGSARVDGESYELTGRTITMTNPGDEDGEVRAVREARLTGEDLLLTAARIFMGLRGGSLERLVATPLARPGTADADSIDLERPEAVLEDYELTADSLEVLAPGERLQRVFASGSARSVSTARDSLNAEVLPELARNDWLVGDTVIIRFVGADPVPPIDPVAPPPDSTADVGAPADSVARVVDSVAAAADSLAALPDSVEAVVEMPVAVPDSVVAITDSVVAITDSVPRAPAIDPDENPPVEEIIARISARSLYRLPPSDSTFRAGADAPAVHYVVGREIRIRLVEGDVREMRVTGQTRGVHLEPLRRSAPTDTSGAAVDTTGAVIDTTGVVVDTTGAVVDDTVRARDSLTSARPVNDFLREAYHSPPSRPPTDRSRDSWPGPSGLPEDHPWIHR